METFVQIIKNQKIYSLWVYVIWHISWQHLRNIIQEPQDIITSSLLKGSLNHEKSGLLTFWKPWVFREAQKEEVHQRTVVNNGLFLSRPRGLFLRAVWTCVLTCFIIAHPGFLSGHTWWTFSSVIPHSASFPAHHHPAAPSLPLFLLVKCGPVGVRKPWTCRKHMKPHNGISDSPSEDKRN